MWVKGRGVDRCHCVSKQAGEQTDPGGLEKHADQCLARVAAGTSTQAARRQALLPKRSRTGTQGALTLTCSCGDELPGEGAGLRSPANRKGVGVAPLQGLVAWVPGLPLVLACGTCSPAGCPSSPEDDREEWAEGAAEFPDVPGAPGTCTAGSEELLGTAGASEGPALAAGLELSDDRLSTLRAGDGVAEGGSEWDRRAAWRTGEAEDSHVPVGGQDFCPPPTHPAPRAGGQGGGGVALDTKLSPSGWARGQRTLNPSQDPRHKGPRPPDPHLGPVML